MIRCVRPALLALSALAIAAIVLTPARRADAITTLPLAPQHEFVAIADRHVCNLLKGDANVRGQDGASSLSFNGKVFLGFGDTYVGRNDIGPNVGNSLGYVGAPNVDPAGDCIDLQHERDGANNATALLAKQAGECGLWPLGMAGLAAPLVHFFYVSVNNCTNFASNGIGLATFDGSQVPGFPSVRRGIIWPTASFPVVQGAQTFLGGPDDGNLYIGILGPTPDPNTLPFAGTARIARVPSTAPALEACVPATAANCEMTYWNPPTLSWKTSVLSAASAFMAPLGANGGVMFGYSNALGKWLATYATGPLFVVRARTSASPTGAWSAEAPLLSYCAHFMLPGYGYCYTGYVHPEWQTNGGNTIYVTMSTQRITSGMINEYTVFLHEIALGRPVVQSVNGSNARRYTIGASPGGFTAEGAAFYESPVATPGFSPVYEWTDTTNGDVLLGIRQPDAAHASRGSVAFYAPPRQTVTNYANAYEPVYRWDKSATEHAYSPLITLGASGYTNAGIAFYTVCGDADEDYLSDCAEINSGNNPNVANGNVDGDILLDANGQPVLNAFGFPTPLGNAQSVAEDDRVRRQDIDNCPLVGNPLQENSDSGSIVTNAPTGPDVTRPNADILGDACDPDNDNDGLTNAQEAAGCNGTGPTNPFVADSDGDHVIDSYECVVGSNPNDAASRPPPGNFASDSDHDGVPDTVEAIYGTDPHNPDTDGDGLIDGVEIKRWGTDPLVADTDGDNCGDGIEAASVNDDWVANVIDLQLVAQRTVGKYEAAFDVNRDGVIDSLDLLTIARIVDSCIPARHIDRAHAQ